MIAKLLRLPGTLEKHVRRFGWIGGTRLLTTQLVGRYLSPSKLQKLRVPGYRAPIYIRPRTADDSVLRHIMVNGGYEYEAGDPRFIIDCGGHIGISAIYFANKYPRATVYAIESHPENFELLQRNTGDYPNIRCFRVAVWPTKSTVAVVDPSRDNWGYAVSGAVVPGNLGVPTITVDELLQASGFDKIDILKVNIEGAEKELFSETCHSWLAKTDMLMLHHHDHFYPHTAEPCFRALSRYDYSMYPDMVVIDKKPKTTMFSVPPSSDGVEAPLG